MSLLQSLTLFTPLSLAWPPSSAETSWAVTQYAPPSSSTLDDLLSHSLTFSLRLIPLTMHVPKTDLIFIHSATPNPLLPLTPCSPLAPLSCITSFPNPSLVLSPCPSPPSHLPIAPPQALPVTTRPPPRTPPPHLVLSCWNLEACVSGVSTNPEPFAGIKPWTCMHLFALSVRPALLIRRVPHF